MAQNDDDVSEYQSVQTKKVDFWKKIITEPSTGLPLVVQEKIPCCSLIISDIQLIFL